MSLKCPTCRRKVTLDGRGLSSLPRNFLLENIVARYKEESAKAGKKARTKPVMCQVGQHEEEEEESWEEVEDEVEEWEEERRWKMRGRGGGGRWRRSCSEI